MTCQEMAMAKKTTMMKMMMNVSNERIFHMTPGNMRFDLTLLLPMTTGFISRINTREALLGGVIVVVIFIAGFIFIIVVFITVYLPCLLVSLSHCHLAFDLRHVIACPKEILHGNVLLENYERRHALEAIW